MHIPKLQQFCAVADEWMTIDREHNLFRLMDWEASFCRRDLGRITADNSWQIYLP